MFYRITLFTISAVLISACGAYEKDEHEQQDSFAGADMNLPDTVFFWQHVAPVLFENCTPCHNQNRAAPFPLTDFIDAKKRTITIRQVIAEGLMPTWPADTLYSRFKDEKTISEREKNIILKWIKQKAPEGIVPLEKPLPELLAVKALGKPDMILEFPDTVFISGDNRDKFKLAKIPFEMEHDTIIRAISFVPGNRQLVHHVNGHLINYAEGKKKDHFAGDWLKNAEEVNSFTAYREMEIPNDDGTFPPLLVSAFNYLPGVEPQTYPDGIGSVYLNKK